MTTNPECSRIVSPITWSRVVSPCNFDGLALSFLAFQSPHSSLQQMLTVGYSLNFSM